jgi:hypothetical protein
MGLIESKFDADMISNYKTVKSIPTIEFESSPNLCVKYLGHQSSS